jgi:hypothetical protein
MSFFSNIKNLNYTAKEYSVFPFKNALQPFLILLSVVLIININSLNNEMAYDDEVVIHKNEFVLQGIKGIKGLLTHDSYYSYYKQIGLENNLPGGRYRPLSLITFSIEQEFIGTIPDGISRENSWDINHNSVMDSYEDTDGDGIFTDYDFWSRGATFRHIVNVILYAFLVVLIFRFLTTYLFPKSLDMVFFACLLFAIHPLHTEVVANIKSRDEILSLLLIFLTLQSTFRYIHEKKIKHLIFTSIYMFLALLAKEYALLLFALIPSLLFVFENDKFDIKENYFWLITLLTIISAAVMIKFFNSGSLIAVPIGFIYIGYYFFKKTNLPATHIIFALGSSLIAYLAMRFAATTHQVENSTAFQKEIIGNPYLFATPDQEWASKIAVWLKYLKLFFIPNPLLADYSYRSIPYSSFASPEVWISIAVYLTLIVLAFYFFIKKSKWAFGLIFMLLFFLPIANVFVDIGATMGERLFFHSSLGACIVFSMLLFKLIEWVKKINKKLMSLIVVLLLFQSVSYAILTIKRNPDWKNNKTLFIHDVKYVPENLNVLAGAAVAYYELSILPKNLLIRDSLVNQSLIYNNKGISIYPNHIPFHLNKAIDYCTIENLDSALASTDVVIKIAPTLPNVYRVRQKISNLYMLRGVSDFQNGNKKEGLQNFVKALSANKSNEKAWNNMAKAMFDLGQKDKALACYQAALKIDPKNQIALNGLKTIEGDKK